MPYEDKAPEIKNLMAYLTNRTPEELALGLFCATCGEPIDMNEFRDELSRREFGISRMCQECQDSVFGESLSLDDPRL